MEGNSLFHYGCNKLNEYLCAFDENKIVKVNLAFEHVLKNNSSIANLYILQFNCYAGHKYQIWISSNASLSYVNIKYPNYYSHKIDIICREEFIIVGIVKREGVN